MDERTLLRAYGLAPETLSSSSTPIPAAWLPERPPSLDFGPDPPDVDAVVAADAALIRCPYCHDYHPDPDAPCRRLLEALVR